MATRQIGVAQWLLIAVTCSAASTSVMAAPSGSPGEQMTIQDTPYTVRHRVIERGNSSKMEVQETSVSRAVTISDLDLSKDTDVAILKERVRKAASDVCREADRQADSPFSRRINNVPDCFTSARRQALAEVNRIVADAREGRTFAAK